MRILFSMRHSGALRNFSSTVEELARRGHAVHLAFMMPDKLGDPRLLQELKKAHAGITFSESLETAPRRPWLGLARATRSVADYLRYGAPEYKDAHALHDRAAARVPAGVLTLLRLPLVRTRTGRGLLTRLLHTVERAIPVDRCVIEAVRKQAPDIVLVTPLVDLSSDQVEYVKAARGLGLASGLCVHSWDNLTNKGLIHVFPDRVFVWNDAQKREAIGMHGVPPTCVVVTGAPVYDQWFARRPSTPREEFCRKVGLPPGRPYLLYLCSSPFIAPREADFVERWIRAVRSAEDATVRTAGILVRPHPRTDMRRWKQFDSAQFSDVVVWPGEGVNPADASSKNDYFDSLYHSVAAVGVNTSAQIEAGVVGRRVYSVRVPEYVATQEGTLHFHYLLNEHGGLLHMADTLDEHTHALAGALGPVPDDERRLRRFVEGFVRPNGLDAAATPQLVDAIEQLGRLPALAPERIPVWLHALRMALYPVATRMKTHRPRGRLPVTSAERLRKSASGRTNVTSVVPVEAPSRLPRGSTAAGRTLRYLFVMQYPGYLRYFDSTVRLLASRGHHVEIAFDSPHKQAEGTEALAGLEGAVEVLGRTPVREGLWANVAVAVRGTIDYVRYLHPSFADAPYLRDRMRKALPDAASFLMRWDTASRRTTRALVRVLTMMERAIPSSRTIEAFIGSRQPDAVLVTPLVTDRCPQVDLIKGAQALGIPAALCVASWDHLTTKGLIRVEPDLVSVWNDEQKREAIEFHGTPPGSIAVTGAQPFDRWFERVPTDRAAFCRKIGLPPERSFVLFAGSTASISSPDAELLFVRRWIEALRREPDLAGVSVLVRPHPYNSRHWSDVDFADLPGVVVYPRTANPVNEADRQDYFDSLYHSEAVVGVNTTAMVEAAIVGRTVHSVLADEFKDTQSGTLHFRYLLAENGGFLRVAPDLTAHARQLVETLRSPEIGREACARFVATFIRPQGTGVASTPILVDALERLARSGRRPVRRVSLRLYPLSALLWSVGVVDLMRHPDLFGRTVRKQFKIVRKRFRNAQKRRRRKAAAPVHVTSDDRSEIPRRKVG